MKHILPLLILLAGCAAPTGKVRDGGRYISTWHADPAVPGKKVASTPVKPAASFNGVVDGITQVDYGQSRKLGDWNGPVHEKLGFSYWMTFYQLTPKKPGVVSISTNLVDWKSYPVPDNGMNFQLIVFGHETVRTNAVPIGIGTPLMIKFSRSAGGTNFFRYTADE